MRKTLALGIAGAIATLVACGSKKEPTAPQPSPALDGGPAAMMPPPPMDAGMPMMTDAGAPVASADAGMMLNTDTVADTAIDLALTTASSKVAPRMDKEGVTAHTTMKEGQHFEVAITMQPNRCYTIVGFAPPGSVTQLGLTLMGPLNADAGHSAAADKTMPVIGKGGTPLCPVLPLAVPYKIDAVATKGAGRVGIQVYSRAK